MSYSRNFWPCIFAAAFLLAGSTATNLALAHSVSEQLKELDAKWVAAFKRGDIETIEAFHAANGLLLPPNSPPIEGPKAIAAIWKSWSELPNVEVVFGPNRIEASTLGDMAYDYGWYTFAFDTDNGRVTDKGKYVVVWKKIGGTWKIKADIFNTNLPAK